MTTICMKIKIVFVKGYSVTALLPLRGVLLCYSKHQKYSGIEPQSDDAGVGRGPYNH